MTLKRNPVFRIWVPGIPRSFQGKGPKTRYVRAIEEATQMIIDLCGGEPSNVVQAGEVPVPGDGVTGELGVTEREDGTFQVTYNGMPLYFWVNDEEPGVAGRCGGEDRPVQARRDEL
mgnify:CR=1 FL=1